MSTDCRKGLVLRKPFERAEKNELESLHEASEKILEEIGFLCFNSEAAEIYKNNGCSVTPKDKGSFLIKVPPKVLNEFVSKAPSQVKLGARNPENTLILDSESPRIYFGSGSETNIWLDTEMESFVSESDPQKKRMLANFIEKRGSVQRLCKAAKLADQLENLDFFIRPVNIQDDDINEDNHDVNKFYASLSNITKHVMAGLTKLEQLDNVVKIAENIVGGEEELRENPVVSFITCVIKSPLQMVGDTTQKLIEIAKKGLPVVISSSPQGGSTAPIQEAGMVAQINSEILCGIMLSQMINPGTPVIYGSVPVRARMDNLHDMYGAPEFNQYNIDCIQMARYYKVPCYSTAGVGDAKVPGVQASIEKLFTHIPISMAGAQYIHYAFGLLDRTNIFCPVQAVLDNQHIGMIKQFLSRPRLEKEHIDQAYEIISKVMQSRQKLYVRFVRKALKSGRVYSSYPFESHDKQDQVIEKALGRLNELLSKQSPQLPKDTETEIFNSVPGIVERLKRSE